MINYIEIEGYRSIKKLKLAMLPINILIGGNGSGKSNFISFFKLLQAIFDGRFQQFVAKERVDSLLYFGRKITIEMSVKLMFSGDDGAQNTYSFRLVPDSESGLIFDSEEFVTNGSSANTANMSHYHSLVESAYSVVGNQNSDLKGYFAAMKIFHFHDTSDTSVLRRESDINDNRFLQPDGRNLAAYLFLLKQKHPKFFDRILKTIQSVAPYISRLILEPSLLNEQMIALRWENAGDIDSNFSAYQLSDGTLRFIALATLLLQPNPPKTVIIDEPELGLHPFAIASLAGMIHTASLNAQVIAATQSPGLIGYFKPEDVIVIDRNLTEQQNVFSRLNTDRLAGWLDDYSLGDLWQQNILNAAQPFPKI